MVTRFARSDGHGVGWDRLTGGMVARVADRAARGVPSLSVLGRGWTRRVLGVIVGAGCRSGRCSAERGDRSQSLERGGHSVAQGQSRSEFSRVRRPWRTSLAAVCSSRWRTRFGSAVASSPVRQISFIHVNRSWAISEVLSSPLFGCVRRRGGGGCACRCPSHNGCCPQRARGRGDATPGRRCRCRPGR